MGLLAVGGLLLSIAYSGHLVKNDIQAEKIDRQCTPTLDTPSNKLNIKVNFTNICKRSGIKLSKTHKPIYSKQYYKGVNYLKNQGYDKDSVEYFKDLFKQKYEDGEREEMESIDNKHRALLKQYNANKNKKELVVFEYQNYHKDNPNERMQKIMQSPLWSTLVHHYTIVPSRYNANYTEVWTLALPIGYNIKLKDVYREICRQQNVKYGL